MAVSPQFKVAGRRAAGTAVAAAAATAAAATAAGVDTDASIYTSLAALIVPLIARGGVEGFIDTKREDEGNVQASDVGVGVQGSLTLVERPLWIKVTKGSDHYREVVGIIHDKTSGKVRYFASPRGGKPSIVEDDDVEQTFATKPVAWDD